MCLPNKMGGVPQAPPRIAPTPPPAAAKPPAALAPTPQNERMDDEETEKTKISTRKKKALEIKKTREGVKTLGAIDPAAQLNPNTNTAPSSGINTPV